MEITHDSNVWRRSRYAGLLLNEASQTLELVKTLYTTNYDYLVDFVSSKSSGFIKIIPVSTPYTATRLYGDFIQRIALPELSPDYLSLCASQHNASLELSHPIYPIPAETPTLTSYHVKAADLKRSLEQQAKEYLIRRFIRYLRKLIVSIIRRMFIRSFIDLRQIFRNIIRFLFKNMDDCNSDDNALMTTPYPHQSLLIKNQNSIVYGHRHSSQYTAGAH